MKKIKKVIWTSLLAILLLVLIVTPVFAAETLDGRIIFGEDFTLEAGDAIDGDLVILGGSVTLKDGSQVYGDVAIMGGSANVAGVVSGDLVIFGGSVDLESTAVVDGQVITFGGDIDRAEGATVRGTVVEGFEGGVRIPGIPDIPNIPGIPNMQVNGHGFHWDNWLLRAFVRIFKVLISVVLIVVIGVLAVVFMPQPLERVSQAVLVAPVNSWIVGFLTAALAAIISGTLIATLCLAPFGGILGLALLIAAVLGWISLGLIVGLKVLEVLKVRNVTPVVAVAVGSTILSLLAAALWIISGCCLGWPFVGLVGSFGLGAVVLTRFGRQEYVPAPKSPPAPQQPVALSKGEGEYVGEELTESGEKS